MATKWLPSDLFDVSASGHKFWTSGLSMKYLYYLLFAPFYYSIFLFLLLLSFMEWGMDSLEDPEAPPSSGTPSSATAARALLH